MKDLIKVTEENGKQLVSARELYSFLKVRTDFTDWCKRMFAYGFKENVDYTILLKNEENVSKNNPIDFALTLDTAKEISMLQRSEKGKEARLYFIECEKVLRSIAPVKLSKREVLQIALEQEIEIERLELENIKKTKVIEEKDKVIAEQTPKVDYVDKVLSSVSCMPISTIAQELGMTAQALNKKLVIADVQYYRGGRWYLRSKYLGDALTTTKTTPKTLADGRVITIEYMYWTQDGRRFLHTLFNPNYKSN